MQRLEPYADQIHRFVARRVDNSADAADIAQQALLQACTKIDTCRGEDVAPWLHTIARHLIVDHHRVRHRFQFAEVTALAETEPALRTPRDAVPSLCERRQRLSCMTDCITRRLRLEQQVAVLLADVSRLSGQGVGGGPRHERAVLQAAAARGARPPADSRRWDVNARAEDEQRCRRRVRERPRQPTDGARSPCVASAPGCSPPRCHLPARRDPAAGPAGPAHGGPEAAGPRPRARIGRAGPALERPGVAGAVLNVLWPLRAAMPLDAIVSRRSFVLTGEV